MKLNLKNNLLDSFKADVISAKAGSKLLEVNNSIDSFIIVRKGKIKLSLMDKGGREITLHNLSDGDLCLITLSCVLNNESFPVNATCILDTEVLLVNKNNFYSVISSQSDLLDLVITSLSFRISDLIEGITDLAFLTLRQRVAKHLIVNSNEGVFYGTHFDISSSLGVTREAVSRAIKDLSRSQFLSTSHKKVILHDFNGLKSICD